MAKCMAWFRSQRDGGSDGLNKGKITWCEMWDEARIFHKYLVVTWRYIDPLADGEGFEPPESLHPRPLSRRLP